MKIFISLTNETRNPNFETNLNDKPINIAKAEATHGDSTLKVFVELRAPNYPGSKYMLIYDPQQDQLRGDLFSGGTAAELQRGLRQDEMNSGKCRGTSVEWGEGFRVSGVK